MTRLLALAFVSLALPVLAGAQEATLKPLPSSAWQVLEQARGIDMGPDTDREPAVQVIFDVNCPYCARLHELFRRDYPGVVTRWVPVAYFKPDSASLAAAILNSPDPQASLEVNFGNYDFKSHHGGYVPLAGHTTSNMGKAQEVLRMHWKEWGGYTPMYVVRDRKGRVFLTGGASVSVVRKVLETGGVLPTPGRPGKSAGKWP